MAGDSDLQKLLLQKLEEYGETVLETSEKKHKKKKHKKDLSEHAQKTSDGNCNLEPVTDFTINKKRRKKKKQAFDQCTNYVESDGMDHNGSNKDVQTGKLKHLESIKSDLGLTEFKTVQQEKERLKEASSRVKKAPEVVVFTSHKKKNKERAESSSVDTTMDNNPEFNLREARFEVRKFGIKGFQGDKKEEAMTSLLVRLGAKPPKNKNYNYKEYQEMRKSELAAEKEKRELERKLGFKVAKSQSRKRKRDKNDVGSVDGQAGKWSSGVQFVKKNDLKGFKMSKIKF